MEKSFVAEGVRRGACIATDTGDTWWQRNLTTLSSRASSHIQAESRDKLSGSSATGPPLHGTYCHFVRSSNPIANLWLLVFPIVKYARDPLAAESWKLAPAAAPNVEV